MNIRIQFENYNGDILSTADYPDCNIADEDEDKDTLILRVQKEEE